MKLVGVLSSSLAESDRHFRTAALWAAATWHASEGKFFPMLGTSFRSEYELAHKMNVRLNAVVSAGPAKRRPVPPRNPGVRDLVKGKRRWSKQPLKKDSKIGFRGWHERGYLPHRDQPGLTQFVTFHLADSFPTALRSEWAHLADIEDSVQRRKHYEVYLDKGRGECWLRKPGVAALVEENLLNHSRCCGPQGRAPDALRYELRAWCIMPNHVHILFKTGSVSMSEVVGAWKTHTGRLANRLLRRRGVFWAEDYFDTFMRDAEHEQRTVRYIENNPTKAKLVLDPKKWRWSSARFQDEFGRLKLPEEVSGPRPCGPQQLTNDKS